MAAWPVVGFRLHFRSDIKGPTGRGGFNFTSEFLFKVLYNAWGTICQMGIGEIQKKLIKAPPPSKGNFKVPFYLF